MTDKPISITRTGDTETATYADGRTETRSAHVPTQADWEPKGTGDAHTPPAQASEGRTLAGMAHDGAAVHLFWSDGSRSRVEGVDEAEYVRVRCAPDKLAHLRNLAH